ncbi:MAG: insulinase family protein, partial [Bacteroidales bacterium]|nr:insulinase family protein [Bacteroidales bacterium]
FTGNTDPSDIRTKFLHYGLVRTDVEAVPRRDFAIKGYSKPQFMYAHNKKFLQSDINIYMPSINFDTADEAVRKLFNEYFGSGMNSIMFQEIREFRSLGYRTYGYFYYDPLNRTPSYNCAYLGTQCDKTYDGVEALRDLLVDLPDRPDKLAPAIEHQVVSRNSSYIDFRSLPGFVQGCQEQGWTRDRRVDITNRISRLTMDDLRAFHSKYIKGRPMVVLVSGNTKKYDPKAVAALLGPGTQATEVTFKQLFKF